MSEPVALDPVPDVEPPLESGLSRGQLFAIYGLCIGAAVAIALLRATRSRRAGDAGVVLAGAPASLEAVADDATRAVLQRYADATRASLDNAAAALDALAARVNALDGRVSELGAGVPLSGTEPLVAPKPATASFNDHDDRTTIDAGEELAAVPLVDANAGAE